MKRTFSSISCTYSMQVVDGALLESGEGQAMASFFKKLGEFVAEKPDAKVSWTECIVHDANVLTIRRTAHIKYEGE